MTVLSRGWRVERFVQHLNDDTKRRLEAQFSDKTTATPLHQCLMNQLSARRNDQTVLQQIQCCTAEALKDYLAKECLKVFSDTETPAQDENGGESSAHILAQDLADPFVITFTYLREGWTEHVYEWALSDPGRMQNAQKGLQDMQKGKKWSTGSRNFAANFVDECSVSAKKQAKARDDFHKKTSLTEFLQTVQKKQIASYLLRRDVAIDKLSPNDQVTVLKLVWTEPGAAECSHPWQDAAGDFVRRAARRREDARIKSWAGKDLDKSRILNLARVLLHRLEDEEVVKMHTELCKLPSKQSSAKDTLTTQAATCQVVSEQTEQATTGIAHADASSLSTLQIAREELSDKLLLAAQTPRVFLLHFPLAKLKTYMYDSGVPKDFKPTSRHAWIEVVVKAWHKEYEDLQAAAQAVQAEEMQREVDVKRLTESMTAVDWGQGLSRDGANFFLLKCLSQKQVASIFNSLTGQNVPSDATGQSQDCLANAKQCTDVANGPYALVMAFTISILSNAVQRYRAEYRKGASDKAAMPEEDGKDSQQKGQADKLDRLDKCRLQCELVLMWRKYGDPVEEQRKADQKEQAEKQEAVEKKAQEAEDKVTDNEVASAVGIGSTASTQQRGAETKSSSHGPQQKRKSGIGMSSATSSAGSMGAAGGQEQPPITSGNTAETTGATAAARAQSTDRKSNVEDISSESDPASEDPNLTTKGDRKEDPRDIVQDVIDQAQLLYYVDFEKVIKAEKRVQSCLQTRLENMGYVVHDEVEIASNILGSFDPEILDRLDLLVDGKVVVELKVANDIAPHQNQLRRYMSLPGLRAQVKRGVLIGFPPQRSARPLAILAHTAVRGPTDHGIREKITFDNDCHPSLDTFRECFEHELL